VSQLTTFVSEGMLFPDQVEQMRRMDEQRAQIIRPVRLPGSNVKPWDLPRPAR